ncbi:rhamnan synthesis F family protein [Sphingomonas profundi]|uniref:rhamnan synthesis F family protein n=1 Tax=Alterirhizorhabdus profundi TaxID=2681549 RepID=UPI0012E71B17|nr:rhamnan synthesis F family protein [Sphingomonas profundi]
MTPFLVKLLASAARKEGNAARDRRDWRGAALAYRRVLALRPEATPIHVQLGHMLKESGDANGAVAAYEAACRLDPADAETLRWLGDLHRREGRLGQACDAFAASHAIDGNAAAASDLEATRALIPATEAGMAEPALADAASAAEPEAADLAIPDPNATDLEAFEPEPAEPEAHVSAAPGLEDRDTLPTKEKPGMPADDPHPIVEPPTPSTEPEHAPAHRQIGHIDALKGELVSGWAMEPDRPGSPVDVEFHAGDNLVGTATADLVRADLAAIGGHGFRTQLDLTGLDGQVWISARLRHTGEELADSPFLVDRSGGSLAPLASTALFEVAKPLTFAAGGELALFVTHSRTGAIKPHVLAHVRALAAEGIATLLIAVGDRPIDIDGPLLDAVAGAIVRENRGYDFACWAHALRIYPQAYAASLLYLTNDSVFGPVDPPRFAATIARVRASAADLVGLTESHEHRWHVQSYFVAIKPRLLSSLALHRFFDDTRMFAAKDDVIQTSEIMLAPVMEAAGFTTEVLFPSHAVRNPTLFGWRELLDAGFPYVKMLLLRGEFPTIDTAGWRELLDAHGFDLPLLDAALAAGMEGWGPVQSYPLLARPRRHMPAPRPLKIAFFGPWNYDNGLGAASRGLIAAIRRCDVLLNLHPIQKPFHVHKSLVPPVPITDFVGPADIAVVHLNPDSWHLLTDDQRALIGAARKRIGHWVWEMAHIPPAWRHDFSSVDRIWAPSGYCARLFEGEGEAPVDVVPYTVPLPETRLTEEDRARLRTAFGVPADRRIILYAFDGSSYLIRKNPMALVRAFAASGLADSGWTLILKTKHLFDRAEEGRALERLAGDTAGVVLINASMSAGEMANLAALCDIYASPHCSEGFGLTIAEAMAAGKPVVATDFGGSTQFLDASCGYPVRAHPWRLEDDFGHYTKGGEWARIDEPALAAALRHAAEAIDAGDTRVGDSARRRVAETLSYDAIGGLIDASFDAVLADDVPISRPTPRIHSDLAIGMRFDRTSFGDMLIAVPLAADLSPPPAETLADLPTDRDRWIVFAPGDAYVSPLFRRMVSDLCTARLDADIVYADDLALGEQRLGDQLRLKPAFDVTLLAAKDAIGPPLVVRASAFARLGGFAAEAGAAALDDLLFRAHALGMSIVGLPETLLAWKGERPIVPREVRRAMLARLPAFAGHDIVDGLADDTLEIRRRFAGDDDAPEVTIVIPTRRCPLPDGDGTYLERLLAALARADWPMARLRVMIGDDIAGEPAWATAEWPFALERIETPRPAGEPFNYAAKMNRLWRAAGTDHLVLMNDDVVPRGTGWLRALMTFAVDESVGGVGARLLYEDGRLQHAGVVPIFDLVAHAWQHHRADMPTYQDWAIVQREWSMVTGAVFATRRALLDQVNGFEERFSLEYNDIDLCLRLRALGYRIVYTPHAELCHAEKVSRGETLPPGQDLALFLERWHEWLQQDPSYHPHLRRDRVDIEPRSDPTAWYL